MYLSDGMACSLDVQYNISLLTESFIMSKAQDSKKEAKKPAAKTMKEKHDAKKAKKAERSRLEL